MATRNISRVEDNERTARAKVERGSGSEESSAVVPKGSNIMAHIAQACPKLHAKIKGKYTRGLIFHTIVNEAMGKPDCNLTPEYCDELETELEKGAPESPAVPPAAGKNPGVMTLVRSLPANSWQWPF